MLPSDGGHASSFQSGTSDPTPQCVLAGRPAEADNWDLTFSVSSFLSPAQVHRMILQNVSYFLLGVGPAGAVQLLLHLSSLVFPSTGARTSDATPNCVLFSVGSRPYWSSTTVIKPLLSCLSFCQHTHQVVPEWYNGHSRKLNGYCRK